MNLLRRLAAQFRKNKKVYVFFICFVIAALFWLLLVLTKDYESTVKLNIVYGNFPAHMLVLNELPQHFLLTVITSGYHQVSLSTTEGENTLSIDVQSLAGTEAGAKFVSTRTLIRNFIEQLGSDVTISSIQPDSIFFNLSPATTVKLPVKANVEITYDKQYDAVSSLIINPDSVMVTMPMSSLGKTTWIETEKFRTKKLRSDLIENIRLLVPQNMLLNQNQVEINLEVEKFTEGTLSVPVSLINVPHELGIKIFPDHVAVKYLVALSHYDNVKQDMFTVVADASSSSSQDRDKLDVQIISSPSFVRSVTCQPLMVDFILKK